MITYYVMVKRMKKRILCIPGWDENCTIFNKIRAILDDYYEFIYVELPGFSMNKLPETPYYPIDYAKYIKDQIKDEFDVILAHSYGGKVALEYYLNYKKTKLILLAPSIIKPRRSLGVILRIIKYKILKKLNILNKNKVYGSEDYKNTSGIKRIIFLNAISTYYDKLLPLIDDKVLLVYGNKDDKTPLIQAKRIKKKIKQAKLKIIKGDHFVLVNNSDEVCKEIYKFMREE